MKLRVKRSFTVLGNADGYLAYYDNKPGEWGWGISPLRAIQSYRWNWHEAPRC